MLLLRVLCSLSLFRWCAGEFVGQQQHAHARQAQRSTRSREQRVPQAHAVQAGRGPAAQDAQASTQQAVDQAERRQQQGREQDQQLAQFPRSGEQVNYSSLEIHLCAVSLLSSFSV